MHQQFIISPRDSRRVAFSRALLRWPPRIISLVCLACFRLTPRPHPTRPRYHRLAPSPGRSKPIGCGPRPSRPKLPRSEPSFYLGPSLLAGRGECAGNGTNAQTPALRFITFFRPRSFDRANCAPALTATYSQPSPLSPPHLRYRYRDPRQRHPYCKRLCRRIYGHAN
jgi:hypothetical protein